MFSQACVIPSLNRGRGVSQHAMAWGCIPACNGAEVCIPACNWAGVSAQRGVYPGGVCPREVAAQGGCLPGWCLPRWVSAYHTAPDKIFDMNIRISFSPKTLTASKVMSARSRASDDHREERRNVTMLCGEEG